MSEKTLRKIVEEWAEFKSGSFSGSDLWSLIREIDEAHQAVRRAVIEECAKVADDAREKSLDYDEIADAIRALAND